MSLQRVHLRINDAATGLPTPVRLRVTDAAGAYYPPHGHATEFPTGIGEDVGGNVLIGRERWAYIDGACEIAVPAGELLIEATKGPEYRPLRERVTLPMGKLALRCSIERLTDLRQIRQFSGDIRAHFVTPHAALLEAAAEDLAVVNLLAREAPLSAADGQTYVAHPNLLAFSGQRPCLGSDAHIVAVNTLNTHPILGKLGLLNCHRPVYPLSFGGPDHTDDWSLSDWCGQCHRKGGLVIWIDAFNSKVGHAGEALADLLLGIIDAMELDLHDPRRLRAWYHLLNAGIRVPIVGGSAKDSNRTALGVTRTYARLNMDDAFSYGTWVDAVRGGRTFITSGPLLEFHVHGSGEGMVHDRKKGETQLRVHFAANSVEPVDKVDLLANGAVVASGDCAEQFMDLDLPAGGWLAVRCWQGGHVVAHTSPQYVQVEGTPPPVDGGAITFLDGHLHRTRDWIVDEGRFANPKSRDHLLGVFDAAREALQNASSKRREPA